MSDLKSYNGSSLIGPDGFQNALAGATTGLMNNPAALYIASLGSQESRRVAVSRLNSVGRMLGFQTWHAIDWSILDRQTLFLVRECMKDRDAATINGVTSMLKGVAVQAWDLKLISSDALQRIKTTKPLRAVRKPRHRNIQPSEVKTIIDHHSDAERSGRLSAIRDAALLAVAYGSGARRSELVAMDIEDVSLGGMSIRIRRGKGNKERYAPLPQFALDYLKLWLDLVKDESGRSEGPIFVRIRTGNRITTDRLTSQSVYNFLRDWTARLGLESGKPHDLRASLITRLLESGEDISTVAEYVGHSSVTTTQRYDMTAAKRVSRAARKVTLDGSDGL